MNFNKQLSKEIMYEIICNNHDDRRRLWQAKIIDVLTYNDVLNYCQLIELFEK